MSSLYHVPENLLPHDGADQVLRSREIERVVQGMPTQDGAGVKLVRVLTHDLQRRLDPFLMLDNFRSDNPGDYLAGFPDHPHRGFETVTYMLAGQMRHRDSVGNEGVIAGGGVQWMTAGRGIIHSEMPEQHEGLMEGFQLWVNLPGRNKMAQPGWRDIVAGDIPELRTRQGVALRVIAGATHGVSGAVARPDTEPLIVDVQFDAQGRVELAIPPDHNAFVYAYRGELALGAAGQRLQERRMAVLQTRADCDGLWLAADGAARALLVAGRPLNEPIAQYGPFVMNTREEVMQAVHDFQSGRLVS
jgi:redox-sensitive bicupin YhaK (pirin superfamily)